MNNIKYWYTVCIYVLNYQIIIQQYALNHCVNTISAEAAARKVAMYWAEKDDALLVMESVMLAELARRGKAVADERVTVKRTIIVKYVFHNVTNWRIPYWKLVSYPC